MQRHVVLSYSVKDLHHVRRLRDALTAQGIGCWPNRILTPGADPWRGHIQRAIADAACVVVALSPETLGSYWVTLALKYAEEYRTPIIPVVVRGEAGHILMVKLAGLDWFDLRNTSRFRSEIAGLADLITLHMTEHIVEMA